MKAPERLRAIVLAAGAGTRLTPLTDHRPKALCPVANVTLLDRWLACLDAHGLAGPQRVAVNAHHLAGQVAAAVGDRAHLSHEAEALGTAGAVAALRTWADGHDVLICNADAYLSGVDLDGLLAGWSRERPRLLTVPDGARHDFGTRGFAGASLLPRSYVEGLKEEPTGLYEVVWRQAERDGLLELRDHTGAFIDCGTPADYLAANLHAIGETVAQRSHVTGDGAVAARPTTRGTTRQLIAGLAAERVVGEQAVIGGSVTHSVIGERAVVHGSVTDSVIGDEAAVAGELLRVVVWPGGRVYPDEHLSDVIRVGSDLTVPARSRRR